jgi:hypothetical protein
MRALIASLLLFAAPTVAGAVSCEQDAAPIKAAITDKGGRWIELNHDQRMFVAAYYILSPATPSNAPLGDKTVLAKLPGDKGGLLIWLDGDKACVALPIPDELLTLMDDVTSGEVHHVGSGS